MRLIYTIYNITMTPSVNSQREEEEEMGKGTCTMQTDLRWREQCQLSARVEEFTPLNADELESFGKTGRREDQRLRTAE